MRLKKGWQLDSHFLNLWENIKHKTRYRVNYDTEELVQQAATAIEHMSEVRAPLIRRVRTYLTFERNSEDKVRDIGGRRSKVRKRGRYPPSTKRPTYWLKSRPKPN